MTSVLLHTDCMFCRPHFIGLLEAMFGIHSQPTYLLLVRWTIHPIMHKMIRLPFPCVTLVTLDDVGHTTVSGVMTSTLTASSFLFIYFELACVFEMIISLAIETDQTISNYCNTGN